MKSCHVKNCIIGEGLPKICVPLVSSSLDELVEEIKEIKKYPVDLIEWRIDLFTNQHLESIIEAAKKIYHTVSDIPLLCTFRTMNEGGHTPLSETEYIQLYTYIINNAVTDILDIELSQKQETITTLLTLAKNKGIKVLLSNHDFNKTPTKKAILQRLQLMQNLGADIAKIAVMPQTPRDVITVLDATVTMHEQNITIPLVTMAMGELGKISRITGSLFGSSITFSCVKDSSAPGQIPISKLLSLLDDLYN